MCPLCPYRAGRKGIIQEHMRIHKEVLDNHATGRLPIAPVTLMVEDDTTSERVYTKKVDWAHSPRHMVTFMSLRMPPRLKRID